MGETNSFGSASGNTNVVGFAYAFSGNTPPISATPLTCYGWYALASGSYLANSQQMPYVTPWHPQGNVTHAAFSVTTTPLDGGAGLPKSTEWTVATVEEGMPDSGKPGAATSRLRVGYPTGFVVARHRAVEPTEATAGVFPPSFELLRFGIASPNTNGYVLERYTGSVMKAERGTESGVKVPLRGPVTLLDYRFTTSVVEQPVRALVTDGHWPLLANAEYAAFAKAQLEEMRTRELGRIQFRNRAVGLVQVVLMALLLAPPVIYVSRKKLKRGRGSCKQSQTINHISQQ
jgi:hypothetical protein